MFSRLYRFILCIIDVGLKLDFYMKIVMNNVFIFIIVIIGYIGFVWWFDGIVELLWRWGLLSSDEVIVMIR